MRMKDQSMKWLSILFMVAMFLGSGARAEDNQGVFPYTVTEDTRDRELSAAMHRSFYHYPAPRLEDNELYSQFKYTPLEGFDYNNGDGTVYESGGSCHASHSYPEGIIPLENTPSQRVRIE
jgi:hypothetical protein